MAAWIARATWIKAARPEQLTPKGNWRVWLVLAGRGWGKTRTGAQDIAHYALWNPGVRVGIIAPTFADARDVCVEGESGLLRALPMACVQRWRRSLGDLRLVNGSRIKLFSADRPERLRGPQHHRIWCDELGAWPSRAAFDQLWFGLRLGADPRVIVTTTPRNTPIVRELVGRAGLDVHMTHGRTMDNAENLAPCALEQLLARYAGTRLGRQELEAELLEDVSGALWTRANLDANRIARPPALTRVVVAVDPALTGKQGSDETGIVAAGRGEDGLWYVLADWSCRASPDGWARRAAALYEEVGANALVAEVNAGGDMVERILRHVAPRVIFRAVHAVRNKAQRALPVAALYEQGKVKHVGPMDALEDQLCRFTPMDYGEGSPDRLDALVWAVTELTDGPRREPKVRTI